MLFWYYMEVLDPVDGTAFAFARLKWNEVSEMLTQILTPNMTPRWLDTRRKLMSPQEVSPPYSIKSTYNPISTGHIPMHLGTIHLFSKTLKLPTNLIFSIFNMFLKVFYQDFLFISKYWLGFFFSSEHWVIPGKKELYLVLRVFRFWCNDFIN